MRQHPDVVSIASEDILTKKQLAARLQCSTRTIENLRLPCLDLGYRLKRYRWDRVLRVLEERES